MARGPLPAVPLKSEAKSQASYQGWQPRHQPALLASGVKRDKTSRHFTFTASPTGRLVHCLSEPERLFVCLALYHPDVFEIWDQYALEVSPGLHPLADHPSAPSLRVVAHDGTLQLAAGIGALQYHPRRRAQDLRTGEIIYVPQNWVTDFVLFLHPQNAEPHCVVWDIKAKKDQHDTPHSSTPRTKLSKESVERAFARKKVHDTYFAQMGIPVRSLYTRQLKPRVVANLSRLCGWDTRVCTLAPTQIADLEGSFADALRAGRPVFSRRRTCSPEQAELESRVLFKAIWHRRLRVDLFSPILVDHPLIPESIDVLEEYAGWFSKE